MINKTKTAHLPIGGHRSGSKRHYALVSREDLQRISERRWTKHQLGYAYRYVKVKGQAKTEYLHRVVMGLQFGDQRVVDHINGNRLDNRRENLRVLDNNGLNAQNRRYSKNRNTSSKYRGVAKTSNKSFPWLALVKSKDLIYKESFKNEIDAALAAEKVRRYLLPYAEPDCSLLEQFGDKETIDLIMEGIIVKNLDLSKVPVYS